MTQTSGVFCTEGTAANLSMSFQTPRDMLVDLSSIDEHSGELSRHTPTPNSVSPLCLLEIEMNPRIINRAASDKHVLYFNASIMMPSSKKKERVQVQILRKGFDRIIMPTQADNPYSVVVLAKDISHYVTRIGAVFKLMLHMEKCQLCTFYKDNERLGPQNIEELHTSLFVKKEHCTAHYIQSVSTVKITLANVVVDRYSEKFVVSILFVDVPLHFLQQYKASRNERGTNALIDCTLSYVWWIWCRIIKLSWMCVCDTNWNTFICYRSCHYS